MLGTMAKIVAYRTAPKLATSVLHPKRSAQLAHTKYDMKHGYAPRISAVGAALVAVPIGFMIGKLLTRRSMSHEYVATPMTGPAGD